MALAQARTIHSNNMLALIGFTVAGIGVSCLPRACLKPLIDRRALAVLKTSPALPLVNYVALYRSGGQSSLMSSIAELAQEVCDFSNLFKPARSTRSRMIAAARCSGASGFHRLAGEPEFHDRRAATDLLSSFNLHLNFRSTARARCLQNAELLLRHITQAIHQGHVPRKVLW
ncbi:LysR substrate-binding domain-containing protein [Variovorax sp. LjRoot84]|uniref:LysR substrate-binding domain-containing protein n=1 Tax=Variovorax sp. LjRoot84 TaxID=3342340 RepID=UPI003F511B4B